MRLDLGHLCFGDNRGKLDLGFRRSDDRERSRDRGGCQERVGSRKAGGWLSRGDGDLLDRLMD